MPLSMLAFLVFLVVTAGVVGVYMALVGRSQAKVEKTIEHRLSELGAPPPAEEAKEGEESLVRKQSGGALPQMERVARSALKETKFERWLEQSGMATGTAPRNYGAAPDVAFEFPFGPTVVNQYAMPNGHG